jgi:hypothetical protein
MWTRRKTVIAGQTYQDDWTVLYRRIAVGRVLKTTLMNPRRDLWTWHSWMYPAQNGQADTLDEALEACRRAVLTSSGQLATGAWIWRE